MGAPGWKERHMPACRPGEDTTPDVTWLPVDLRGMAGQPKPQNDFNMPDQPSPGARLRLYSPVTLAQTCA